MKNIIALTISLLPFNLLRIFLYNKILRYNINKNSSIGF